MTAKQINLIEAFGQCNVSIAILRSGPSHREEQVSEILLGEKVEIISVHEHWTQVSLQNDGYTGWCLSQQLDYISPKTFTKPSKKLAGFKSNSLCLESHKIQVFLGSEISNLRKNAHLLNQKIVGYKGDILKNEDLKPDEKIMHRLVSHFYFAPYRWGGRTAAGVDCSGLTQMCLKLFGIQIPRDASEQAEQGQLIDFVEEVKMGDLAFFDNSEGKINHVGILLDEKHILHASDSSGRATIDLLDREGIISKIWRKRTHHLRLIRRYF